MLLALRLIECCSSVVNRSFCQIVQSSPLLARQRHLQPDSLGKDVFARIESDIKTAL
jgi:hypothetical protein